MNTKPLHAITLDELRYRLDCAADSLAAAQEESDTAAAAHWHFTAVELRAVLAAPTVATLAQCRRAADVLELSADGAASHGAAAAARAITDDLCRAGYRTKFDANVWHSRRPRTRVVDGVRYEI